MKTSSDTQFPQTILRGYLYKCLTSKRSNLKIEKLDTEFPLILLTAIGKMPTT
jgi:hypothetical protein